MLIEHIKDYYSSVERDREWSTALRGSSSGKCTRAIAYQYHDYKPHPLNWRARLVFRLGDLVEQDLQEVAKNYGLVDQQKEVSIKVCGTEILGHIDGRIDDTIIDFKSTTTYGIKKARKGDIGDYIYTMHFYMYAMGFTKAILVYYCKETSDMCEVPVFFDITIMEQVFKKFEKVLKSTKEELPDRDFKPEKDKLPWQCSYCAFNAHCYPDYKLTFKEDGKPEFKKGDI